MSSMPKPWLMREAVIREAYIQGVSTRSVEDLVQTMGMTGISKSQVSRLRMEIEDKIRTFLERPPGGRPPRRGRLGAPPHRWRPAKDSGAHAAGELVRVGLEALVGRGDAHLPERIPRPLPRGFAIDLVVRQDGLDHLGVDPEHRVEGHHGMLKDHGDLRPAKWRKRSSVRPTRSSP